MFARKNGRIINVSSGGAYRDYPYGTAYCASKAALSNFSHNLSLAIRDHGIKVLVLSPAAWTGMPQAIAAPPKVPEEGRNRFRASEARGETNLSNSVSMLMLMASGRIDTLAGRHIGHQDSPELLLNRTEEIIERDLLTIRRREP